MFEAKLNNPKCLGKTCFAAYSVWTIGFICIFASIQTATIASPIYMSIASNDAVINIEIKNKAALNISINLGSTDSSTETSGENRLDCKLHDSTIKQLESTAQIKATEQTTATEQIKETEQIKPTEQLELTEQLESTEPLESTEQQESTEQLESAEQLESIEPLASKSESAELTEANKPVDAAAIKEFTKKAILNDDVNETKKIISTYYNDMNDIAGFYPLHYAAEQCKPKVAKMLIENGANVNIPGAGDGWRPIHTATYNDCIEIVHELINNGADLNARIRIGYSALEIAIQDGRREIAKLLSATLAKNEPTIPDTIEDDDSTSTEPIDLCELYGLGCVTEQSGEGMEVEVTTTDMNEDDDTTDAEQSEDGSIVDTSENEVYHADEGQEYSDYYE